MNDSFEIATLAAGCFWGVESLFQKIPGVIKTKVGYTGGHTSSPSYEDVCTGTTHHAEAVQIQFNPTILSYSQLLEIFWSNHDPTTLNRQGPDIGSQYRSAIFYHSPQQQHIAETLRTQFNTSGFFKNPIVTEIEPASPFYEAEEYHQRYFEKHGGQCHYPSSF